MKQRLGILLLFAALFLGACKSNFEKVRTSGNQKLILDKAFEYYEKKQYLRSQTLFDLVIGTLRGDSRAEKAAYHYAYTYYHQKQYVMAAYYFKTFTSTYINSAYREEAAYMSAYCNYLQSPSYRLDQTATSTAIDEFQTFINLYPQSRRVTECNKLIDEMRRKLEEKSFAEGQQYFDMKQYQSAVVSFDNLLRDYPESPDVERVRFLIAKANFLLSENSVVEKKEERYAVTIQRCDEFLAKYPNGKYATEVKNLRKSADENRKAVRKKLKNV